MYDLHTSCDLNTCKKINAQAKPADKIKWLTN